MDVHTKGLWSSLLDSVSSNKKLPEKHVIVLGGDRSSQQLFLETLQSDTPARIRDRQKTKPIVAQGQTLGYTYLDVLDADHEDVLARMSLWFVPNTHSPIVSLLDMSRLSQMLLVVLLDWQEPWAWVRQLRDWVRLLRNSVATLDAQARCHLDQIMQEWQTDQRGPRRDTADSNVAIPLAEGEWDEPLGLPLCVVCQNTNHMEVLDQRYRWRDEEYDFILQYIRTILMKHGASLVYTSPGVANSLPTLVQASLDIRSPMKRQTLKHEVLDREQVLVPPRWDSWGKIGVIREGFDVEGISKGWSIDIQGQPSIEHELPAEVFDDSSQPQAEEKILAGSVLGIYESRIRDPDAEDKAAAREQPTLKIEAPSLQEYLASQQDYVARLAAEDEGALGKATTATDHVNEHIGPIQVNMGGIQVDADDVIRKLQKQSRPSDKNTPVKARVLASDEGSSTPGDKPAHMSTPEMKAQNDALQSFFSGLMKRGATNSPRGTPKASGKDTPK